MALFFYPSWDRAFPLKSTLIRRKAILFVVLSFLFSLNAFASCLVSCRTSLNLSINLGDTIFCSQVGQTLNATVIETASGNSCTTMITVYDNLNPQIYCSDTTLYCGQNYSPDILGYPLVIDNCTDLSITDLNYVDVPTNYSCFQIDNGDTLNAIVERRWTAIDEFGNQGLCIQMIRLKKSFIADVQLPPNLNGTDLPPIDCQSDPEDLNLTGFPNIDGLALNATNFCDLAADYTDQEINTCGAGYLIIRKWTLADWCTGEIINHNQLIMVADTLAPTLNCPQDLTISTAVETCTAIVNLPTTTASDDCSLVTITPTWQFGVGYGPFTNIPLGQYPVTYTATDACGNSSSCIVMVTIADLVPPTNVCAVFTQVNLGLSGQAFVPASSFDEGTHDNCNLNQLLVARFGDTFSENILFDCQDIVNSPILVTMRAVDYFGNYNECDVYVNVIDQLAPQITCADDITLSCLEDYLDINITGSPVISDNCSLDTTYFVDQNNLNACNVGTISRIWTTIDLGGTQRQCTQLITLIDTTTLSISFPLDYSTTQCNPDLSPGVTGMPIISNDDCEALWVGFTDDTVSQAFPACFVIYRHWEIYEWCTHDPQTNAGYWEASQTIIVEDNEDPVITVPADSIVYSLAADCGLTYINLPIATADDCSQQLSIINFSTYAQSNGADASGFYPPGIHAINFLAQDNCGNTTSGQMQLTVLDGKEPTAVCRAGLIFNLDQSGSISIDASEIDNGSFDNCTPASTLTFSLSPNTFTCDDLGSQLVTLTVTDLAGNSAECVTAVTVQDNLGSCPSGTISGNLHYWSGYKGINGGTLELSGGPGGMTNADLEGDYQFQSLPLNQNYLVEVSKDGHDRDGISILDIVLLSRSIIGLAPLTNPFQILAGDIDRDNKLTVFDLVQMQKLILIVDTIIPNSNSWRFVPDDFVFTNPLNPFLDVIPEFQTINNLQPGETITGFIGVKLGDISGNADTSIGLLGDDSEAEQQRNNSYTLKPDEIEDSGVSFYPKRASEGFGYQALIQLPLGLEEVKVDLKNCGSQQGDFYYVPETGELRILKFSTETISFDPNEPIFEIIIDDQLKRNQQIMVKESKMVDKKGIVKSFNFKLSSD